MRQEFPFEGATVVYTYDGPLEYTIMDGETTITQIRPDLSYEERYKRYANIRRTNAEVVRQIMFNKQAEAMAD